MDGLVTQVGYHPTLGIYIRLKQGDITTLYGHLSQVLVGSPDTVSAGKPIGISGATGRVTGEHLHLSIRYHNRYIDPIEFLYKIIISHGKNPKL
jgi:murein DD-endopeptidase MepM/ murein hydrolase activator NlpD